MESGYTLNADIVDNNNSPEAASDWGSLMKDERKFTAAFAAHALQKQKARERITQEEEHSVPEVPYKQQRKEAEEDSGHIGTSKLDIRDKTTGRQAIQSEFSNYGVSDGDYKEIFRQDREDYRRWREAYLREHREKLSFGEVMEKYNGLFAFLKENTIPNQDVEQKYQAITGQKEKLQFILDLPLVDKVKLFCSESFGYANYDSFMQRLQFQQDFINGTAMVWAKEWDDELGEDVDVQKLLDPDLANPRDIRIGLERASLRSAMIGTPEYGAYKMALDFASSWGNQISPDYPRIKGYESGIYKNDEGSSIGNWQIIIDEYQKIADRTAKRRPDLEGNNLEYRAVRDAAWIFAKSMKYNKNDRGSESPFVSLFDESVAWVQLGPAVKPQFQGMRQKIANSCLYNIERFIGKSGFSRKRGSFESEKTRLNNRVSYISSLSDEDKQKFLEKENAFEIKKQEEWREKEKARIDHKYNKLIGKTRSEERRAVLATRQESEIQRVIADTSKQIDYFKRRTLDGLLSDIDKRRELLSCRIEKRKSLAEKAIELHFATLPHRYDDEAPRVDCGVDWINEAPFGLIKKAHRLLSKNLPQEELVLEIMKLQGFTDEQIKTTIVDQAVELPRMDGDIGEERSEYMERLDAYLKKAIGDNYKETDALDGVKSRFLENLYEYENLDVAWIFSDAFMRSSELVEAAKKHFFLAADSEGQLKYFPSGSRLFNAGSFGPGSGVLTIILEKYILPNEPDFFSKEENIRGTKELIMQSAFLTYNEGAIREVSDIVENYANSQDLSSFCEHFASLSEDIKERDASILTDIRKKKEIEYPYLITPKICTFYRELSHYQDIELPDVEDVEYFLRSMISGREKELDDRQKAIEDQQDALSAQYREEVTLENIGRTLAKSYARCFAYGISLNDMIKHKSNALLECDLGPALKAGFSLEDVVRYPFLVSNLLAKERTD